MKIPRVWQQEIDKGTEFGKRCERAVREMQQKLLPSSTPTSRSKIGSRLKDIIFRETGHDVPCSECKAEIEKLNTMSSVEVLAGSDELVERIFERSKSTAQKWSEKAAIKFTPGLVKSIIRSWVKEACHLNDADVEECKLNWSYCMTTVPSRSNTTFPRTLESLMNAGFEEPRLFIDGARQQEAQDIYGQYNLPITSHFPTIRTAGTWILALYEIYVRNPWAARYAIFQDDFVTVKNLRAYLERVKYPSKGYLNLYTFPCNEIPSLLPKGHIGWYPSNQLGRGAVALVFSSEAARGILGSMYMTDRFQDKDRGYRAIDGGIVEAVKRIGEGWKEYVHSPSLVQHIGDVSSMGNSKHQKAASFPGENFDALELLNRTS